MVLKFLEPAHQYLNDNSRVYKAWHSKPYSSPLNFMGLLVFLLIFGMVATTILPQVPKKSSAAVWTQVWGDEFNDNVVDTTKFGIEDWTPGGYSLGGYLHYGVAGFHDEMVTESNGTLNLRTEKTTNSGYWAERDTTSTYEYKTGGVATFKKYTFLYGKVNIRAQLPKMSKGMWPAFWFVAEDSGRNCDYEVDLMEAVNTPNTLYFNYHDNVRDVNPHTSFTGPDYSVGMHDYEMEWMPDRLILRVDGIERLRVASGVPDKPMYLIINNSVGGTWPGSPDSTTVTPTNLAIDFIHYYKESTDATPPTVSLTAPVNGSSVSGLVNVAASVSDNVGISKVEFFVDGILKSASNSSPYVFSWDSKTVVNGSHVIKARSYDTSGNTAESSVTVNVGNSTATPGSDTNPPVPTITAPVNGSTVSGVTNIIVSATDNVGVSKVSYYIDSNLIGASTALPHSFSWDTKTVANGTHKLKAVALDVSGNSGQQEIVVNVSNNTIGDIIPPTISIIDPPTGTTVTGGLDVVTNVSDNLGVTKVEFYINDVLKKTDIGSPFSYYWDTTNLPGGSYNVKAKAFDAANNAAEKTIVLKVGNPMAISDTVPPKVTITSPLNGSVLRKLTTTIAGNASDSSGIKKIEIYLNSKLFRTGYGSSFSFSWANGHQPSGSYTILAKAYDNNNNISSSYVRVYNQRGYSLSTLPETFGITTTTLSPSNSGDINLELNSDSPVTVRLKDKSGKEIVKENLETKGEAATIAVNPGDYQLTVIPTDPNQKYSMNVTVPEKTPLKEKFTVASEKAISVLRVLLIPFLIFVVVNLVYFLIKKRGN